MNKWVKILLVILIFAAISALLFIVCKAFNITDIGVLKSFIEKGGKYGYLIYTCILVVVLVCFCFVPFINSAVALLGVVLFGSKIAFITNMIAVFISTSILFFIGDKFGEKFAKKLVGEKSLNEAQNLVDHKSKFWIPIFFLTPGIPDEAICLVAGMTKIKYWYIVLVSLLYHSLEVGLCCFIGSDLIVWSALSVLDWIVLINIVIIDIYLLIRLEKYLEKKTKK